MRKQWLSVAVLLLAVAMMAGASASSEATATNARVTPAEPLVMQISDSGASGVPREDSLVFSELRKLSGVPNRPQNSIVVIESLDDNLSIEEIKREFGLRTWFEYIQQARRDRAEALSAART